MENHFFNINIATRYGVNCAIILQNVLFWTEKNKEKNINFFDGKYWTYNPVKEFKLQFPYLTERQIRTALDTLKDEELILTANYNKTCDRTLWYTVTQKALDIMTISQDKLNVQEDLSNPDEECIIEEEQNSSESILKEQKCQNEMTPASKGNDIQVNTYCHTGQNEMTQVSNGTNKKPQIINSDKLEKEINKEKEPPDRQIYNFWNSRNLVGEPELNNKIKAAISTALKSFTLEEILLAIERYDLVHNSDYWFRYAWRIDSFLGGKAIRSFLDNGEHWINYCNWKKENRQAFISNGYTHEQIASCIADLDTVEV